MKHGPFFYALYTGVACIIIMVLLLSLIHI